MRNDGGAGGEKPIGLGHERGDDVGDVKAASEKEDDLDLAVGAFEHQEPDDGSGQRDSNVFADMKNFHGGGDAREFGDHVGQVHEKARDHDEEGGAETKFLAN